MTLFLQWTALVSKIMLFILSAIVTIFSIDIWQNNKKNMDTYIALVALVLVVVFFFLSAALQGRELIAHYELASTPTP